LQTRDIVFKFSQILKAKFAGNRVLVKQAGQVFQFELSDLYQAPEIAEEEPEGKKKVQNKDLDADSCEKKKEHSKSNSCTKCFSCCRGGGGNHGSKKQRKTTRALTEGAGHNIELSMLNLRLSEATEVIAMYPTLDDDIV